MSGSDHPLDPANFDDDKLIFAEFNLPRENVEEDAPALLAGNPPRLIGVFDGLGGACSRKVEGELGSRSSAFYASRVAREAVKSAVEDGLISPMQEGSSAAHFLSVRIGDALAHRNATFPVGSGVVRSSLIKSYPTTAAMVLFDSEPDIVHATALWSGDSRCYSLSAMDGLQQLSQDDSRSKVDPMAALREDGPMSSMLSADGPCNLHANSQTFHRPVVLITATDGAYGCLPSPMHFEYLLLEALATARDDTDWSTSLSKRLIPIQNDDISISAVLIGWTSMTEAAAAFAPRMELWRSFIEEYDAERARAYDFEQAAIHAKEKADGSLSNIWRQYRTTYMARAGNQS